MTKKGAAGYCALARPLGSYRITPDEAGRAMLEKTLRGAAYDCVVIVGGLRIPPKSLAIFEMVVNAVHKAAPTATIAFNTRPEDTAEAAAANSTPANGV
jgi:hypothetical protein